MINNASYEDVTDNFTMQLWAKPTASISSASNCNGFFGECLGIEIAEVQPVRLFTFEEEQELRKEKIELMSR